MTPLGQRPGQDPDSHPEATTPVIATPGSSPGGSNPGERRAPYVPLDCFVANAPRNDDSTPEQSSLADRRLGNKFSSEGVSARGLSGLARRLGRNSAFDHGGNIAIALLAGAVGYAFSQRAVFLMVPVFAALTSAALLAIPADAINPDRARDLDSNGDKQGTAAGYRILFETRPLMVFALCAMLFHLVNAPLVPLVGQKLALEFPKGPTAMMSFCMVAAQGVMLPIAFLVFFGFMPETRDARPPERRSAAVALEGAPGE
jgi:hypothetical protein